MGMPRYVQRRKRADGSFSYRGWAVVHGERVYSPPFDNATDAHLEAVRMRRDIAALPGDALTLRQAFDAVEANCVGRRSSSTLSWYQDRFKAVLQVWPENRPLLAITASDLDDYVETRLKTVSGATVNHELTALGRAFALAQRAGHVPSNPVRQIDRPRVEVQPRHFYTTTELADVLQRVRAHDAFAADLILILASTGLRRSEMLRLRPEDCDVTDARLWVRGKRGNETVAVAPDGVPALQRLLPHLPIDGAAWRQAWRRARTAVGHDPRLHPHALRHTFITALARAGTPLQVLQRVARLRSVRLLETYYHHGDEVSRALDALRLPGAEPSNAPESAGESDPPPEGGA